ncbi:MULTISPECIES: lambda-exonuclease family protein [Morganellaceae]|uniref:lambda-exonuclease family protein n=1 Tax=Morganellaceae TaxID=1903414 RepID=UPI00109D727B|nr:MULTISPECIES: YqaJ viral recombinase family protein [Providencia]THB25059.1 DNA recombinase [Providencia sp. MGF014]TNU98307.1 DNA recombinase [Providencia rettgeri]WOB88812.1 YqaJ viral recombinase family protein [Providencia sp. PROV040]
MSDSICEIVDIEQGTPEWHKWRRTGVTATCSPILMGAPGAMKTPYQLYLQYAGLLASEDLSAIKQVDAGNKLEALARSYCENELGQIASPFCVRHAKYPFMIASLDGQLDDRSVLEIKNLSEKKHLAILEQGSASPEFKYYFWQVQHQLFVTGAPQAYLVFWSAKDQPKIFLIKPNQTAFNRLFAACKEFWERLEEKVAPAFDKQQDILLISDAEILAQTSEFTAPDDLSARIADIRRQVANVRAKEVEFEAVKAQLSDLEETLKASIQGLAIGLGFNSNDPIRIDGFGFRYLESKVKGRTNWKMISERLNATAEQYPDCVTQESLRSTLSVYEYDASPEDSVYVPPEAFKPIVAEGDALPDVADTALLLF